MIFSAQFKENVFVLYGHDEIHPSAMLRLHCLSSELFNSPLHRHSLLTSYIKRNYPSEGIRLPECISSINLQHVNFVKNFACGFLIVIPGQLGPLDWCELQ